METQAQTQTSNSSEVANIYEQKLQERIDKEVQEALSTTADSTVKEADEVVAETKKAIQYLADNNYEAATKALETAIGKAEVIVIAKPNSSLVPLKVKVRIHDLITDIETLKNIRVSVADFVEDGYLQSARQLLNGLVSEITIKSYRLPLGTYPDALTLAAKLIREGNASKATQVLRTALNTIVVQERSIPMPLIRAEVRLEEVETLLASKDRKKDDDIHTLLDTADYQIRLAETLGYGKKDKEFAELYDKTKELKAEVKKMERSAKIDEILTDFRKKLKAFKKRVSI